MVSEIPYEHPESASVSVSPLGILNVADRTDETLDSLLKMAAQRYMTGTMDFSHDQDPLLERIREQAALEIDEGDGLKVETVRVERKLDGSVSIFFGI